MSKLAIVQITLAAFTLKLPHIVFIAETWFLELSVTTTSNYSLHRKDKRGKAVGVCIFTRNDLEIMKIPELNCIERNETQQVWISVTAGGERILVGCVNRPPGHSVLSAVEFFSSLKWTKEKIENKVFDSVIMCGDFNYFNYLGIYYNSFVLAPFPFLNRSRSKLESQFSQKLQDRNSKKRYILIELSLYK